MSGFLPLQLYQLQTRTPPRHHQLRGPQPGPHPKATPRRELQAGPLAQELPRHARPQAHPRGPQTQRTVSTGEELCTRGGRLLTPLSAAASAFQAGEPANRTNTPTKAKKHFLDITSSSVVPRLAHTRAKLNSCAPAPVPVRGQ